MRTRRRRRGKEREENEGEGEEAMLGLKWEDGEVELVRENDDKR